jgi:hypothetical protein
MKIFARPCLLAVVLLAALVRPALAALDPAAVAARLERLSPEHPRLFLAAGAEKALAERTASDPVMQAVRISLLAEADRGLKTTPVKRVQIGRRLLDKSRTALSRVLHLSLAWRLTGRPAYLERARAELVAVAAFTDWNPSHFLDVAEMTTAVGLGYDWLYPALDPATRTLLRDAIVEKGLKPSRKSDSWSRGTNNWNQVCNGGMTVGALAVAESEPALAAQMVARAVNTVPRSMHEYAPDGAYPEGASYWGYGTTYNVILISALQSVLGTDFGLSAQPGFMATADYYLHVIGPSGHYFNYSDAGRGGAAIAEPMFWFAAQRRQPYLLWHDWAKLTSGEGRTSSARGRTDPFLLLWIAPNQATPPAPPARSWTGHGVTPVAFHRSSWDRAASFVAIKGGTPSANHAHMDVGAFVMDADGLRWADDLGSQDYNSLESAGIKLWGREQNAERWNVFRLGTSSHNVLQVDGQQQRVAGTAPIVLSRDGRTVVDTSSTYAGQLGRTQRGVALREDRTVLVQDEFITLNRRASVRWAMVTHADVTITGPGRATLTQAGKQLSFRVLEPADATLAIYPTDPPPAKTDARNKGTRMIGFEVHPEARQTLRLVVQLVPASAAAAGSPGITPLAEW